MPMPMPRLTGEIKNGCESCVAFPQMKHSSITVGESKTHAGKNFEHTRGKHHAHLADYSRDETDEASNVVPVNERTQRQ
jgi:hypothetical protein